MSAAKRWGKLVALGALVSWAGVVACDGSSASAHGASAAGAGGHAGGTEKPQPSDGGAAAYPYAPAPFGEGWTGVWGSERLSCDDAGTAGVRVTLPAASLVIGWQQVSSDNQDPVLARVEGDTLIWCRSPEQEAPDGRGYGLAWNGGESFYAAYTVVGGGTAFDGASGWLSDYGSLGSGGNKTVTVLARHRASDGQITASTFVAAQLGSRRAVNSLSPRALTVLEDGSVELLADSAFSPVNADGSRMCGDGEYPFGFRARFSADLKQLLCADTERCSGVKQRCPETSLP